MEELKILSLICQLFFQAASLQMIFSWWSFHLFNWINIYKY